ncbi:squalene synthase HpnC [Rhodoligotrophos defluvii]|uniref:squalene synthase HpnC n=1 Tax=Rhodoligotrophos defluvii TaxID=2561934 RepID=UPI0010C98FA9|nr:squalene synthase HpnC [Rhodoligotrophos defluvii]
MIANAAGRPPASIEAPSGKGASDENFPVGSWLLPARLRPHVACYYAFARAIDDIADDPKLASAEKLARLDLFGRALRDPVLAQQPGLEKAAAARGMLAATGITDQHCLDLVSAFKQDAVKNRYKTWAELMDYCDRSASPVGRFLLDLHGEDQAGYVSSDALCNALQVINHLQDCGKDRANLDRVYLPTDWLDAEGETVEALDRPSASAGLRRVLDKCLDGTEELLREADRLPGRLKSRRLAMESAVIVKIAWQLADELRRRDPLAERVVLTRPQFLRCGVRGVRMAWFGN